MVNNIRGFNLDAYLVALEGWRRGLTLNWILNPSLETDLKIIGFNPLGKSFSLRSDEKTHYFYRSRGDKVANSAVEICTNKQATRERLIKAEVPTPKGKNFNIENVEEILSYVKELGYPIVVKPTFGSLGKGVHINVQTKEQLINGIEAIKKFGYDDIIVEQYFKGEDYRLYVVGDKVVAATKRVRANIIGNGKNTIEELIQLKNKKRKENPYLRTKLIKIDENLQDVLTKQKLTLQSVPRVDEIIYLREVANISAGGDPIDATSTLPTNIKKIAIEAIKAIPGMVHGGVDILVHKNDCTVIEINSTADILMHIFPAEGKPKNIPAAIIDHYFPETIDNSGLNEKLYFGYRQIRRHLLKGIVQSYQVIDAPKKLYKTRYIVSGKVQGVNYRRWIRRQAVRRGLHGYTRNLKNGKVVVVVGGDEEKVKNFKKTCQKGSPRSKVEKVTELSWNRPIKVGFVIRKTR